MIPARYRVTLRIALIAIALVMLLQGFFWKRFHDMQVFDSDDEFNPAHNVETYWDDDLDREVEISWSRRDVSESFIMRAASWEALDTEWDDQDQREIIFVNSSREPCAA